jgi:hypothetical protein
MSDEFNVENRTFADGEDPLWTALDKPDNDANAAGGGSLHFYNSTNVRTTNGMLEITTRVGITRWNHYDTVHRKWQHMQTNFTSGMIVSNQVLSLECKLLFGLPTHLLILMPFFVSSLLLAIME